MLLFGRYQRPPELELDYGMPTEQCHETGEGTGVFQREWTKASVAMDCNVGTYGTAIIKMK